MTLCCLGVFTTWEKALTCAMNHMKVIKQQNEEEEEEEDEEEDGKDVDYPTNSDQLSNVLPYGG
jgi:hypothetical protein